MSLPTPKECIFFILLVHGEQWEPVPTQGQAQGLPKPLPPTLSTAILNAGCMLDSSEAIKKKTQTTFRCFHALDLD